MVEYIIIGVGLALIIAAIIWESLVLCEVKRGYYYDYNGHRIEFKMGYSYVQLIVDGNICDEAKAYFRWNIFLKTQIGDDEVELRVGKGMWKPIVKLYVNSELCQMTKNPKEKKNDNK